MLLEEKFNAKLRGCSGGRTRKLSGEKVLKFPFSFSGRLAFRFFILSLFLIPAPFAFADAKDDKIAQLEKDLATVTADRDNVLKQAKSFLQEKDDAVKKLEEAKKTGAQTSVDVDASKKEMEILRGQLEAEKNARTADAGLRERDRQAYEAKIADLEAKSNSLAQSLKENTPEHIQELNADRNRLEEENKKLALKLLDNEKTMQDLKRKMAPFELDREEVNRLRAENKEYQKRMKYVGELEKRQQQLIKENAENREKLEVLKAKFKEAVPGLAKSSRISQKMMRENADMHYNLGTIFLQNKQYKEAIREYEQVLELRPNDPDTHYNLGVLYDDYQRDREKALYHYQKYLAMNPKAPDAKKVETYILSLELEQKVR